MRLRTVLIAALGVLILGISQAPPATADPKNSQLLELECDVLGSVDVVVFSNATLSPGLVVGSNGVLVPYAIEAVETFTPPGGQPETNPVAVHRPAPRQGRLDHCTFDLEDSGEFGTFEISGDVWVSYTPTR
ncbi:MAG: hypothetical protein ABWZ76_01520 [Acidimicrobiales bacterium]